MLIKLKHIHTLTWKVTQNSKREGSQGQNLKLSRKKNSKKVGLQTPKKKNTSMAWGVWIWKWEITQYSLQVVNIFQLNKLILKVTCKYLWFAVFL